MKIKLIETRDLEIHDCYFGSIMHGKSLYYESSWRPFPWLVRKSMVIGVILQEHEYYLSIRGLRTLMDISLISDKISMLDIMIRIDRLASLLSELLISKPECIDKRFVRAIIAICDAVYTTRNIKERTLIG